MAPGVGKTCRMLEEAHSLKQHGIDVVIGLLETHDRFGDGAKGSGAGNVASPEYYSRWVDAD